MRVEVGLVVQALRQLGVDGLEILDLLAVRICDMNSLMAISANIIVWSREGSAKDRSRGYMLGVLD